MKAERNAIVILAAVIAALGIGLFAWKAMWWGLPLFVQPQNVASVLAPLILTAAFIERAVEVVITPWRDPGTDKRFAVHAAAASIPGAEGADPKAAAKDELNEYKGKTKQYAFAVALMFGLAAAIVGVRVLWPFLAPQAFADSGGVHKSQQNAFILFDVVLSAALLAGGANGIHSVVNAFTTYFDTTAQKAQKSANS